MSKKLDTILLIDDDIPTNFFHKKIIQYLDCAREVVVKENGKEAFHYLQTKEEGKYPQPELIFLDINMPMMDGWEFLEEYQSLEQEQKGGIIIVMLTTSLNPDDEQKAKSFKEVNEFESKPLTETMMKNLLEKYFIG